MNIAHAAAYGITIWLSILLFTLAAGDEILPVVWWGPVIISATTGALVVP